MKVYFSVVGIGLGHMVRSLSIAEKLEERGVDCVFSSFGKAVELAKKEDRTVYESEPLMWVQDEDKHVDVGKTLLRTPIVLKKMLDHFEDEYRRIRKEEPDLMVTDSRYSTFPASQGAGIPRVYITNQPKVCLPINGKKNSSVLERVGNWFNYRLLSAQDAVLLPDFPNPNSISSWNMDLSEAPEELLEKAHFVGPIAPHRPDGVSNEKIESICEKYGVEPNNFIYIAFSGPGEISSRLKEAIFQAFPEYDIPAIMGTGKPGEFEIHEEGNLKLVDGWIEDREELLAGAELVLSRAGLCTLSEITAFGKKAVVIPQHNQPEQKSNAEGIEGLGLAKEVKPEEIDEERLLRAVEEMRRSRSSTEAADEWKERSKDWIGEEKSTDIIMKILNENG